MRMFPNNPYLHILYANFLLEVRKDGPAARTQLQLASKHSPNLVYRYQVSRATCILRIDGLALLRLTLHVPNPLEG